MADAMKLLVISNLYAPYIIGGYEMLAATMTDELRRRGHEVHIATGYGKNLAHDGYTHGVLNLDLDRKDETFLSGKQPTATDLINWYLFDWRSYRNVRRLIHQLKPDLASVWNLYLASQAPLLAAQHEGIPTAIYIADKWLCFGLKDIFGFHQPANIWHHRLLRVLRAVIQPVLYAHLRPKHIITVSEFMRQFYVKHGFPPERMTCIHSGVHTKRFSFKRPLPAPDGSVRLLYMSSLWEGKGPQVAVHALGQLVRKGYTRLCMDICGEGTQGFKDWLKSIIIQEGVEEYVHLQSFASQDKVVAAYHSHDIVVFTSIWDEPFASVPMEAMSCGLAIVATTAGGTPEAIIDGETGLLVPPNNVEALSNALERLVVDAGLRQRLGEHAAQIAREQFDVHHWADRLEAYYANLITKR